MRIFSSTSFWIFLFCLLIACLVGQFTHWIVGVIIFCILIAKTALVGLVIDTLFGALEYHHDRQDIRAKKSIASLILLKAAKSGVRPKL